MDANLDLAGNDEVHRIHRFAAAHDDVARRHYRGMQEMGDLGDAQVIFCAPVHRPSHFGGRFSKKASIPSAASWAIMLLVITLLA
jgi:hypothetical protein